MTPACSYTGSSYVVGRDVSQQPPWSMETSQMTPPGRIDLTIGSVITFGALAPGTSTAPTTRSACATHSANRVGVETSSSSDPDSTVWSSRSRDTEVSSSCTWAPTPSAIAAALYPT